LLKNIYVSLLQKSPSSPVTCHATGFYPNTATLFWRRDGEELHEGVEHGEALPNPDGTFQMSSELRLSSVSPEDWGRHDCVFQLSGVEEDLVTRLDPEKIVSNRGESGITKTDWCRSAAHLYSRSFSDLPFSSQQRSLLTPPSSSSSSPSSSS
uniref:Ig-like domain-containing protein n=1 Tax=Cynoglossus semilaevis TaxID=244447 RepID=A0A3P8WVR3_CYNSE